MIPVSTRFWDTVRAHSWVVHARGRAASLSMSRNSWNTVSAVHINPAWSMAAKRTLLRQLATQTRRTRGFKIRLGDWKFVAAGESPQERASAIAGGADYIPNSLFDELFDECVELQQHERTWQRLPRSPSGEAMFCRLDHLLFGSAPGGNAQHSRVGRCCRRVRIAPQPRCPQEVVWVGLPTQQGAGAGEHP